MTHSARLTDESALARARGRLGRPFAEAADPWLTEARTVAAHGALQRAQAAEREFLIRAFAKVKALELQRSAAIKDVIAAFVVAYRFAAVLRPTLSRGHEALLMTFQ